MATALMIRRMFAALRVVLGSRTEPEGARARADLEARLATLQAKEEIREVLLRLAKVVDDAILSGLSGLAPQLHASFDLRVIDVAGREQRFVGAEGLVEGYAPIMASGRASLMTSAIPVELDGTRATAFFKLASLVKPSPALGMQLGEKVLLLTNNTATLVYERGAWKLASLELAHLMSYPEAPPKPRGKAPARGRRASKG
jgi:hypothetical protein